MSKEALPFDFEVVGIRPVGVLSVGLVLTTNHGVAGVEVWLGLDVAVVDVPMVPSQNTTTPKNI